MARVIRNLVFILIFGTVMFNLIVVIFSYTGAGWIDSGFTRYFVPSRQNFRGFEFWFDKISSFPGLQHTLHTVQEGVRLFAYNTVGGVIFWITVPFQLLWNLIIDVLNMVIWIFNLLDPYHNFTGF